jgi:hypothetical protein
LLTSADLLENLRHLSSTKHGKGKGIRTVMSEYRDAGTKGTNGKRHEDVELAHISNFSRPSSPAADGDIGASLLKPDSFE